jgi:hypothetical protein
MLRVPFVLLFAAAGLAAAEPPQTQPKPQAKPKGKPAFRVEGGDLYFGDWFFDPWALDWPDAFVPSRDNAGVLTVLRGWNRHGVNCLLVSAQNGTETLYGPDGQLADPQAGRTYTRGLETCRFHLLPTIINLFSARPADALASADAYRTAVATAVRCLPEEYYGVFLVGDVVSGQRWPADHPFPLNKPANVLELCREVRKRYKNVLLGVPADIFPTGGQVGDNRPVIYVAHKLESVEALFTHLSKPGAGGLPASLAGDVFVLKADRLLLKHQAGPNYEKALEDYLQRVEKERLAIRAPLGGGSQTTVADQLTPQEKAEGWISLFDGRSLDGWTTLRSDWASWAVEDGAITCRGSRLGAWLRTRRRFSSFVLRLEYRISERGNSGVFVRAPLDGRASRFGLEIQIMGRHVEPLDDQMTTGAIYASLAPREDASRPPGQWNDLEVICRGPALIVRVNGHVVQDVDLDADDVLRDRLREGVIGLQDHGDRVWFRNIRIRELKPTE